MEADWAGGRWEIGLQVSQGSEGSVRRAGSAVLNSSFFSFLINTVFSLNINSHKIIDKKLYQAVFKIEYIMRKILKCVK